MAHVPFFLTLSRETQLSTLEALIFASDEPLTHKTLFKILVLEEGAYEQSESTQTTTSGEVTEAQTYAATPSEEEQTPSEEIAQPSKSLLPSQQEFATLIDDIAYEINDQLLATARPYRIVKIAGGFQFATTREYGEFVARLMKSRTKRRLSQAALEVLAIVAYKQPISKPEIEAIRGVNSNEVINSLAEKNLVTLAGRSEAIGKPLLYATTDDFLRTFGLHSISDLPKLRELDELFQTKAMELASELNISVKATSEEIIEKVGSMISNEQSIAEQASNDESPANEAPLPTQESTEESAVVEQQPGE